MKKQISKLVLSCLCVVSMLASVLNVSAANQLYDYSVEKPGYGIVSATSLKVRSAPSTSGTTVLTTLASGSYVMLIGQSGDFYYVQYDTSGSQGYVHKDYVTDNSTPYCLRVSTSGGTLNFRSNPSASSSSICSLQNGTRLAYRTASYDDWYAGVYGNKAGYVSKQYVWTVTR